MDTRTLYAQYYTKINTGPLYICKERRKKKKLSTSYHAPRNEAESIVTLSLRLVFGYAQGKLHAEHQNIQIMYYEKCIFRAYFEEWLLAKIYIFLHLKSTISVRFLLLISCFEMLSTRGFNKNVTKIDFLGTLW